MSESMGSFSLQWVFPYLRYGWGDVVRGKTLDSLIIPPLTQKAKSSVKKRKNTSVEDRVFDPVFISF